MSREGLGASGEGSVRAATEDRIVGAALRALARRRPRELSVSDVCDEAQVARATFYRYFKDKQEVLDAVPAHYVRAVAARIADAIADTGAPADRMPAVLSAVAGFRHADADVPAMMEVAPEYTRQLLGEAVARLSSVVAAALTPAIETTPPARDAAATGPMLADLVLRLLTSTLFLPGPDADEIPAMIMSLWSVALAEPAGIPDIPRPSARAVS